MPTKHEPKPCTVEGCDGTMIYTHFLVPPHGDEETLGAGRLTAEDTALLEVWR